MSDIQISDSNWNPFLSLSHQLDRSVSNAARFGVAKRSSQEQENTAKTSLAMIAAHSIALEHQSGVTHNQELQKMNIAHKQTKSIQRLGSRQISQHFEAGRNAIGPTGGSFSYSHPEHGSISITVNPATAAIPKKPEAAPKGRVPVKKSRGGKSTR